MFSKFTTRQLNNTKRWLIIVLLLTGCRAGFTQPSSSRPSSAEFNLRPNEIRFDGRVRSVNATEKSFVLEVTSFTLPNGKTSLLRQSKPKTIITNDQMPLYDAEKQGRKIRLAELVTGAVVIVIGKDLGSGSSVPARAVVVAESNTSQKVPSTSRGSASKSSGPLTLIEVATFGFNDDVRDLLKKGADVNMRDETGWTPLMLAAGTNHEDTVRILLAAGADVNAKNDKGETTLMIVAPHGYTKMVQLLLDNGADVNAQSKEGFNALSLAIGMHVIGLDRTETMKALLDKGANPNAQHTTGTTPLMVAASNGSIDMVKVLIAKGADVNAKNKMGLTVLQAAEQGGRDDVVQVLKNAGAK